MVMTTTQTGYLITFEGCEGAGKTTQAGLLSEALAAKGKETIVLREPGGTAISEQIREVVLSTKNMGMADTTEVLLFQAARAQIYEEVIIPALNKGGVVLMDRSRDSSVVYQGIVRGFGKPMIEQLNDLSTHNVYPNVTFLLDLPAEVGMERRAKASDKDRIEHENPEFHQRVREAYLSVAKEGDAARPGENRWVVIDGLQTIDQIAQQVLQVINNKLHI